MRYRNMNSVQIAEQIRDDFDPENSDCPICHHPFKSKNCKHKNYEAVDHLFWKVIDARFQNACYLLSAL